MTSLERITPGAVQPALLGADTFADFYRTRYRGALRLAIVLTGSTAAAEDLVQDAMADAHRHWHRLAGYDDPNAWLRRAVANRAISRRRRLGVAARGVLRLGARTGTELDLTTQDWELWARDPSPQWPRAATGVVPTRSARRCRRPRDHAQRGL
jgi:DNA-directed RNA polymerase specialized sigma24 family protein